MEALAAELRTPMRSIALDLTKMESVEALRALLERERPDVRVLINSAGFGKFGTYADMTLQETADMVDLNCKAAVALTAAVLPHMGRGGRVLEICSSASFQPLPGFNVYAATKTQNGRTVRCFPFALRPETVARRALRDSRWMAVTTCGLPALVQRVASKFLPHCFIMACWEGLRRL